MWRRVDRGGFCATRVCLIEQGSLLAEHYGPYQNTGCEAIALKVSRVPLGRIDPGAPRESETFLPSARGASRVTRIDTRDKPSPLVVGLGEVLFDCFPERSVLGGAPLNVAIHANALLAGRGGAGVPVSRVGGDDLGERFFAEAEQRGLTTGYVQRDPTKPTGRVDISLDSDGQADYRFAAESAWDALAYDDDLAELARRCDGIAFGTLGQRSPTSRQTITRFVEAATQALRLFDVNLRQHYHSPAVLDASFRLASTAKLNEDELREVTEVLALDLGAHPSTDEAVEALVATYEIEWLALTRGAEGTVLYRGGTKHIGKPVAFEPEPDADSVGAGDACCAGLLCGTLLGMEPQATLDLANRLGAHVAARPGATPPIPPDCILSLE